MHWYVEFERWYIGGFLTIFGLVIAWQGAAFNSCSRFFFFEMRDAKLKDRFAPVVERRKQLESGNTWAWRITGLSATVFGVLVLVRVLDPVVGYALLCADLALMMSQIYLNMRNNSERRAASLQPRTATSAVPAVWYAGGVVCALLPLAYISFPNLRVSAVIVAVACAAIVIVAARTAQMAALLAGDDPDIEVYVDNRLRWSRVTGLLTLAYAASYVFIALSKPGMRGESTTFTALYLASCALFFGFSLWASVRYFRSRMRVTATSISP